MQQVMARLSGSPTEFKDTKFVAKADGRNGNDLSLRLTIEVTRVQSQGIVKIQFNVMTKGMAKFGYTEEFASGTSNVNVY
jgi:hypothetical protein